MTDRDPWADVVDYDEAPTAPAARPAVDPWAGVADFDTPAVAAPVDRRPAMLGPPAAGPGSRVLPPMPPSIPGGLGPPLSEGPMRGRVSAPMRGAEPETPLAQAFDPYGGYYSRADRGMPPRAPGDYSVLVGESIGQSLGEDFTMPSGSDWWNSLRGTLARTLQGYELDQLESLEDEILGRTWPAFNYDMPKYSRSPEELRELQSDPLLLAVREQIAEAKRTGQEITTEAQDIGQRNPAYWPQVVMGATNSLAASAPALAATMTTRNPVLGASIMYPTTKASEYGEMREGGTPRGLADKLSTVQGLIEAGTELPALSPFAKEASPMLRRFGETLAADVPGETVAGLGQSVVKEFANADPNAPMLDPIAEGLSKGLEGLPVTYGTVLATGGAHALAGGAIDKTRQKWDAMVLDAMRREEARNFELTTPTPEAVAAAQNAAEERRAQMARKEPFISGFGEPMEPVRDPNIQPDLPMGTMPEPAITGSRAPESAGEVRTAPTMPAAQETATPPLSAAFEPPAPVTAAPPAPPAPQEPAPTPAPQAAPAVSTAPEPPVGEAAPFPVVEDQPHAKASLAALKGNTSAPVVRFAPDPRGGLTTADEKPIWQGLPGGSASREYITEINGERYPVQEIRTSRGKVYQRGYNLEGQPFDNIPEKVEKLFNTHFPAPAAAPAPAAPAPAPAAAAPAPPAPTPITKGKKKAAPAPAAAAPVAPAPAPVAAPAPPPSVKKGTPTGKRETVTTAAGRKVDTEFEVVDAADLTTSDNPSFPQDLQPRERGTRVVSQEQVAKLAGKIDPALLGSNTHAEHGAPIIGKDDNLVESGNGRVMALRQMYERNPELAAKYRDFVAQHSGQDVSGMKAPILVRRRATDMTHAERQQFTKEANKSSVAKMSAAEQAKLDQDALTPAVMAKLPEELGEGFDLSKGEGNAFVSAFVAQFSPAERGDLVDADGRPSTIAVQRATAALLTRAYGGTPAGKAAIRRAVESKSGDTQTIVKTLVRFAPAFAKLKDDIAAGRVQDQADIGPQIAEAVEVVRAAAGPGDITNWLKTEDLLSPKDETVKQLVQTFYQLDGHGNAKRLSTAKTIADTLSAYIRVAKQHAPEQPGGGLFGEEAAAPVLNPAAELGKLNVARQSREQARERQETAAGRAQGGLFTAGGQPSAAVSSRARDEGGGEEEQPTGPREERDASRAQTQDEGDQADFLTDELRRPKRRKSKRRPGPYSMTREGEIRASEHEQIWTDAGLDPDLMELAPPPVRFKRAAEIVAKRFGFRTISKAANLNWGEAIDALKDAYVGLTNLAAVQNLNPAVLSLNGRLALSLEREHAGALAYYQPGTKTIGMTRRNDAFAHEWAHALDHYLVETFAPEMLAVQGRHLTGKTRAGGVAETMDDQVRDAYIAVLNSMYFDGAKAALYVANLEKQIATAKTEKQRLKFQTQLDNFRMGHSKKGGIESGYYEAAKAMDQAGPEGGASEGYWQRPTEMWARSYEAYIANKLAGLPADHPFVTQSKRMYDESRIGTMTVPYPQQADRDNIFRDIDTLMRALRDRSMVDSGNAPAAIVPTDTRYWKKLAPSLPPQVAQQVRGWLARLAAPFQRQLAETHRADREARARDKQVQKIRDVKLNEAGLSGRRRWLANQGLKAIESGQALPQMIGHSIRGIVLALDGRHRGNTGLAWLRGKFATDPGSGRFTGAVWNEEVRHWEKAKQNIFAEIVKKHDVRGFNDAELRQLRDVLVNAIPETSVSEKIKAAAADMRRFMNDMYSYNVSNGVNIGYAKNGYLPRIIDSLIVENDLDGFRAQARILYARVYPKEVGTLSSVLADPLEHPERLTNLIQYVREIAKTGRVLEAKNQAIALEDDAAELENALQELKEASENGEDTTEIEERIQELGERVYDGLRDPWAMEAAFDWENRIRGLGAEPEFAFEKRGPTGKYTKSRVLPAETDEIMGDYLKNDPLELITTYISQSVRRVEFGKFFGNEEKGKALGWKLDAALNAANAPYRAADGSMQRITADEFEELQKSIDLLVGRYNTNMTKRGLRWRMKLTALLTPVILARSLRSQIAEPFVTGRKTGNLSDGFRVFYKQMQDVAAKVGIKGAKQKAAWRREMAEYFGIVADHMADQLMLQRYNLMDLNSSDRVKMARFFQVIGVHPHAVAMRRAVAEIFMTRYAPKMARRVLAGGKAGELARGALAELGLDSRNAGLIEELARLGEITDVQELHSLQHIDAIRTAINRFTDTAVQNPSAVDKPRLASMPEYSFMYGIMSFQFAYQRNVLIATAKEIHRTWQVDKPMAVLQATSAAASMSLIMGGQLAAWIAGMALWGDDDWEEIKKKVSEDWLWQSMSRAGMFGAADPVVNSFLGLKYERDMSQIMAGPLLQIPLKAVQDIGRAVLTDDKTNTLEHRAVESMWTGAVAPYVTSKLLAIAGANPWLDAALGVGLTYLTSPMVSDEVADIAVGDTKESGGLLKKRP